MRLESERELVYMAYLWRGETPHDVVGLIYSANRISKEMAAMS